MYKILTSTVLNFWLCNSFSSIPETFVFLISDDILFKNNRKNTLTVHVEKFIWYANIWGIFMLNDWSYHTEDEKKVMRKIEKTNFLYYAKLIN